MPDRRGAALLVALVAVLVYANSLSNGYAYDDVPIIENNRTIQTFEDLPGAVMSSYWPGPQGTNMALWRPVTTAMFGLQYIAGDGSPLPFHITNVALHGAVSALVVLLLAHFMSLAAALVAGLVFAVHPVHTEAVANIVGLSELVSAGAVLLACLLHIRGGERSGWVISVAIAFLYAVGFGAKESAVTLPGLVFLVDAARERLGFRDLGAYIERRWRVYFLMLVTAIAMLAFRVEILGSIASPTGPMGANLLMEIPKIWTLGEVWTHYVRLWVFPMDLSADYSPNVIPLSFGWNAANLPGLVLVLATLSGALFAWRRAPLAPGSASARIAAFGVMWFVIAISPISNTLFLSGVLLAERTLYLPSVGLSACVGWLFVRMARDRPRAAPAVLLALLVAASVHSWQRNPVWKNNQTLFGSMLEDYPHSGRSQWLLADNFLERGQIPQALFAYAATVNLLDGDYAVLTHVAGKLSGMEMYEGAEGLLDFAIRDRPGVPVAYGQRAGIRAEYGDARGAERYARASLAMYPRDALRLDVLAWALASRDAWEEAEEARARAEAVGTIDFWHRSVYDAYLARRAGDTTAVRDALDSAAAKVRTRVGSIALDSIRVDVFRLDPLLPPDSAGSGSGPASGEPPDPS